MPLILDVTTERLQSHIQYPLTGVPVCLWLLAQTCLKVKYSIQALTMIVMEVLKQFTKRIEIKYHTVRRNYFGSKEYRGN